MSLHKLILNNLQETQLSIAELQDLTPVSLPTLRKAIQELSDAKWIHVTGQSESSGGRPAMLFGLDPSYYAIVSVHLQLPGIRLITSDVKGTVLNESVIYENLVPTPEKSFRAIKRYMADMQEQFTDRSILGIGIASPGYIDPESGNILSIERVKGWQNFPICDHLRAFSGLPVYIANDIDCMALAEFQHSRTSLENNLMYVGFDEGVKVSMFLNGQLYKGAFGNVGLIMGQFYRSEAHHTSHDVLTIHGINSRFEELVDQLSDKQAKDYDHLQSIIDPRQRLQAIFEHNVNHDPICQHCVTELVQALVKAVLTTTYLIHPDVIVIGGVLSTAPISIYKQIESDIYTALPSLFANHLTIRQAELSQPNRATIGASHHFLTTYLSDQITDPLNPSVVN